MTPEEVRKIFRQELATAIGGLNDKFLFQKSMQIFDGRNIQVGKNTGTQIGTEALQKIGFYGVAPVAQQSAITAPSGGGAAGVDNPARGAIVSLIAAIKNMGITA